MIEFDELRLGTPAKGVRIHLSKKSLQGLVWHNDSVDPVNVETIQDYLIRHGGADTVNLIPATFQEVATTALNSAIRWKTLVPPHWDLQYPYSQLGSVRFVWELSLQGAQIKEIEAEASTFNFTNAGARATGVTFFDPADPINSSVILTLFDNLSVYVYLRVFVNNTMVYSQVISVPQFANVRRILRLVDLGGGNFGAYANGVLLPVNISGLIGYTGAGLHFWHDAGASGTSGGLTGFDNLKAFV